MEKNNENRNKQSVSRAVSNDLEDRTIINATAYKYPPQLFASPDINQLKEKGEDASEELQISGERMQANQKVSQKKPEVVNSSRNVAVGKNPVKEKKEKEEIKEAETVGLVFASAPNDPGDEEGNDDSNAAGNNGGSGDGPPTQLKDGNSSAASNIPSDNGVTPDVIGKMESTIGHNFSNVNFHTNSSKAAEVGALAYTQGTDVHFAPGQFNPSSQSGQELIGHELTHVKQQAEGRVKPTTQAQNGMAVNDDKGLEKEADEMGAKASTSSAPVQRKKDQFTTHTGYHQISQFKVAQFEEIAGSTRPSASDSNMVDTMSVVEYITMEMNTNVNGSDVSRLRNYAFYERVQKLLDFANLVKGGAVWDHKSEISSGFGQWSRDDTSQTEYFFDIWSNVHYGYIGKAAGFTEFELLQAPGAAQVADGTVPEDYDPIESGGEGLAGLDDPLDQEAIKVGFYLWDTYSDALTTDQVISVIRANKDKLSTRAISGTSENPVQQKTASEVNLKNNEAGANDTSGPIQLQHETVQFELSQEEREQNVRILNTLLGYTMGFVPVLNAMGFEITGYAIGLRGFGMAEEGVGIGAGSDFMFMVDIAEMRCTGDVVPFVEVGLGAEAGLGVGLVVAYRISPQGEYGDIQEGYEGNAWNASIEALAGIGFSISAPLLVGDEGFAGICISLGTQAGAGVSLSHAVSTEELIELGASYVQPAIAGFISGIRQALDILDNIGNAIQGFIGDLFAPLIPERWNLPGYTDQEAAAIRSFVGSIQQVAQQHGLEIITENISAIFQRGNIRTSPLFTNVRDALNHKYHMNEGGSEEEVGNIWELDYFNDTTFSNFVNWGSDANLFSFGSSSNNSTQSQNEQPAQHKKADDLSHKHSTEPLFDQGNIIQKMETSFGTSFSSVKIHENSTSAKENNALAYTQGSDIHFAPGQFKPDTRSGQELIGHELTHVVQQREGRVKPTTQLESGMSVNDDPAMEKEADVMGAKAAQFKLNAGTSTIVSENSRPSNAFTDVNQFKVAQFKNPVSGGLKTSEQGFEFSLSVTPEIEIPKTYVEVAFATPVTGKVNFKLKGEEKDQGASVENGSDGSISARARYTAYKNEVDNQAKKSLADLAKKKLQEDSGQFDVVGIELEGGADFKEEDYNPSISPAVAAKVKLRNGNEINTSLNLFTLAQDDSSGPNLTANYQCNIPISKFWENNVAEASIGVEVKVEVKITPNWSRILRFLGKKAGRRVIQKIMSRLIMGPGAFIAGLAVHLFASFKMIESIYSIKNAVKKAENGKDSYVMGFLEELHISKYGKVRNKDFDLYVKGVGDANAALSKQITKIQSHAYFATFGFTRIELFQAIRDRCKEDPALIYNTVNRKAKSTLFPHFVNAYYKKRADEWTTPEYIAFKDAVWVANSLSVDPGIIRRKDGKENKHAQRKVDPNSPSKEETIQRKEAQNADHNISSLASDLNDFQVVQKQDDDPNSDSENSGPTNTTDDATPTEETNLSTKEILEAEFNAAGGVASDAAFDSLADFISRRTVALRGSGGSMGIIQEGSIRIKDDSEAMEYLTEIGYWDDLNRRKIQVAEDLYQTWHGTEDHDETSESMTDSLTDIISATRRVINDEGNAENARSATGLVNRSQNDTYFWSASTISYIHWKAGMGDCFDYAEAHITYLRQAQRNERNDEGVQRAGDAFGDNAATVGIGDVLVRSRNGGTHGDVVMSIEGFKLHETIEEEENPPVNDRIGTIEEIRNQFESSSTEQTFEEYLNQEGIRLYAKVVGGNTNNFDMATETYSGDADSEETVGYNYIRLTHDLHIMRNVGKNNGRRKNRVRRSNRDQNNYIGVIRSEIPELPESPEATEATESPATTSQRKSINESPAIQQKEEGLFNPISKSFEKNTENESNTRLANRDFGKQFNNQNKSHNSTSPFQFKISINSTSSNHQELNQSNLSAQKKSVSGNEEEKVMENEEATKRSNNGDTVQGKFNTSKSSAVIQRKDGEIIIEGGNVTIIPINTTYDVSGTYDNIRNIFDGKPDAGKVKPTFANINTIPNKGKDTDRFTVDVTLTKVIPKWKEFPDIVKKSKDPKEKHQAYYARVVKAWTKFKSQLDRHEKGHLKKDNAYFKAMPSALKGKTSHNLGKHVQEYAKASASIHTEYHGTKEAHIDPLPYIQKEVEKVGQRKTQYSKGETQSNSDQVIQKQDSNLDLTEAGGHPNRNQFNQFPTGLLTPKDGTSNPFFEYREDSNVFVDEAGREWTMLSDDKNVYHQPPEVVDGFFDNLGQNISSWWNETERDPFPNKKFISRDDDTGGSFEAILQPNSDGSYSNNWLNTGTQQGTYNFYSPEGFWGNAGHILFDVLPHYANDDYSPTPVQEKSDNTIQRDTDDDRKELKNLLNIVMEPDYLLSFIEEHGISYTAAINAVKNAAASATLSNKIAAAITYATAAQAGHPVAGDVASGAITVQSVNRDEYKKLTGSDEGDGFYSTMAVAATGQKADTLYLTNTITLYEIDARALIIHELTHANDDKNAIIPEGDSHGAMLQMDFEINGYRAQSKYMMDQMLAADEHSRESIKQTFLNLLNGPIGIIFAYCMLIETKEADATYRAISIELISDPSTGISEAQVEGLLGQSQEELLIDLETEMSKLPMYAGIETRKIAVDGLGAPPVQQKTESSNKGGNPSNNHLQIDVNDVHFHQNSTKASELEALAYTQGSDIHFAPGQFKPDTKSGQALIGHELAHVQQQKEGRVQPTTHAKGTNINDDKGLEKEADDFGIAFADSLGTSPTQLKIQDSDKGFSIDQSPSVETTKAAPFQLKEKQSKSNSMIEDTSAFNINILK